MTVNNDVKISEKLQS